MWRIRQGWRKSGSGTLSLRIRFSLVETAITCWFRSSVIRVCFVRSPGEILGKVRSQMNFYRRAFGELYSMLFGVGRRALLMGILRDCGPDWNCLNFVNWKDRTSITARFQIMTIVVTN